MKIGRGRTVRTSKRAHPCVVILRTREWKERKKVCLPRRCSLGCPECAAIDRNHGGPPDTVHLSPIRCTSASIEMGTSSMQIPRIKIRFLYIGNIDRVCLPVRDSQRKREKRYDLGTTRRITANMQNNIFIFPESARLPCCIHFSRSNYATTCILQRAASDVRFIDLLEISSISRE